MFDGEKEDTERNVRGFRVGPKIAREEKIITRAVNPIAKNQVRNILLYK